MSMFGLGNIFSRAGGATGNTEPVTPMTPAQQGNPNNAQPAQNPASADQNTTVPNSNTPVSDGTTKAFPAPGQGEKSPLDGYKELWKTTDATKAADPKDFVPNLNFDPKALAEQVSKFDFTSAVPKDVADKALKGDSQALTQAINLASQATFTQAMTGTAALIENALKRQADSFRTDFLPQVLRNNNVSSEVRADEQLAKLYDDPAVKPIVEMVEQQLTRQNPMASPEEIRKSVASYMGGFASKVTGAQGNKIVSAAPTAMDKRNQEVDWGTFFGANS